MATTTNKDGNGNGNGKEHAVRNDVVDQRLLLSTLLAVKKGDFAVRMPVDHTGVVGKIYDALNDVIELEQRMSGRAAAHERASRQGR